MAEGALTSVTLFDAYRRITPYEQ